MIVGVGMKDQMSIQDILIKGLSDNIIKSVKDHLKKNYIKEKDIKINIEIIESGNPCIMKVQTTIYRRDQWRYLKKVSGKT